MENIYYFVTERKTNKILGFNLTEEQKNELFYPNTDKSGRYKIGVGRSYGATNFKITDENELKLLESLRGHFTTHPPYSFIIITNTNKIIARGLNYCEQTLLNVIKLSKNELEENRKQLEDMDINGIDDTVTFLKVKSRITELEGLLEKSEEEYNDVLGLQKEFEELQNNKLYENFLNSSSEHCVKHEFSDNMLLLQKQMYKKFLEIEKICNQMKDLEKDYKNSQLKIISRFTSPLHQT